MRRKPSSRAYPARSYPRLGCALAFIIVVGAASPAAGADPAAIRKQLDKAAGDFASIQTQQAETERKTIKFEADLKRADATLATSAQTLRARIAYLYRNGNSDVIAALLSGGDLDLILRRMELLARLEDKDAKIVDGLKVNKARADEIRDHLNQTRQHQSVLSRELRTKQIELEGALKGAQGGAKVQRFGKYGSFTLPIAGPTAFVNSWGAPRSGGRRHKGTDVMASCGAPVVAVTDGTLQNLHSGGLGGIMAYERAGNGDVFFYAHLRSYANGAANGKKVGVGQLIGYNGNTGDARGGPCHVHFEFHPGGGSPVNPYPLLNAVRS